MTVDKVSAALLVVLTLAMPAPVAAQDAEGDETDPEIAAAAEEQARAKAQADLLTQQTALITAQKAYIEALPLPEFENKTELADANAGSIEATMLSAVALGSAARKIAADIDGGIDDKGVVLLTAAEEVDLTIGLAMRREIDSLKALFVDAGIEKEDFSLAGGGIGPIEALTLVSELGGLLGSESKLAYRSAAEIDDNVFVTSLAGALVKPVYTVQSTMNLDADGYGLLRSFRELAAMAANGAARQKQLKDLGKGITDAQKQQLAKLEAAATRFAALEKVVLTKDDKGLVPLYQAARVMAAFPAGRKILRVQVIKAGGSVITEKNFGTTILGADPMKITGGIVVGYRLSSLDDGQIARAGILSCGTDRLSLRNVHRKRPAPAIETCQ